MHSRSTPYRVALLGYGTVGAALHRALTAVQGRQDQLGAGIEVVGALVRDPARAREAPAGLSTPPFHGDLAPLLAAEPDCVCEALGGLEPARTWVLEVLRRGVPVVTANKQLVARHGDELFAAAAEAGTQLRYEAAVCGAMPVVRMLRGSLSASRVDRLVGILNGTTNYMLSSMDATGDTYVDALAEAQRLGYAEADPTDDVSGGDAAAKLAILASIVLDARVLPGDVEVSGIERIEAEDLRFARTFDCTVKLVGRVERPAAGEQATAEPGARPTARLQVTPMLVPHVHPLASVGGATNAVFVAGDPFGELTLQGQGAGGDPTASAMAGDVLQVLGSTPGALDGEPGHEPVTVEPADERPEQQFVRMRVPDRPGVLAAVAGSFAAHGVSVERVVQERGDHGAATLVVVTHPVAARDLRAALADVPEVGEDAHLIPMLEVAQ
jgi:homoserine dehydrogenase